MAVDLSVEWMGIKFPNPFIIASTPPASALPGGFKKAAKYGWGGAIHWMAETIGTEGGAYHGYIAQGCDFIGEPSSWWAFQNSVGPRGNWDPRGKELSCSPERIEAQIRKAKESGLIVGANLQERTIPKHWAEVTKAAVRGGADFVEVNWSCPYVDTTGYDVGANREVRRSSIKAVRENTDLPIMVKLNASFGKEELAQLTRDAIEGGANAISVSNTLRGLIGVDIETGIPLSCELCVDGSFTGQAGGISGPSIKPMILRAVGEIRKITDLHISGIGGITDWRSAVEYMLMGATTVQIGTGVMLYGYRLINQLTRGLTEYMERKGFKRISDFVGKTTDNYYSPQYIHPIEKQPRKMIIDEAKCTGCGRCLVACEASSSGAEALRIENEVATINNDRCVTCNTCRTICPKGAISVVWEPGRGPKPLF